MARIAFVLLCHRDPDRIVAQARMLVAAGDCVAIHFDGRAPAAEAARIREALSGQPGVTFARRRMRCGWGEWSLVAATLETARAALRAFPDASHLYLVSGDCMPVKSSAHAREVLDRDDVDHIESVDFHEGGWIRTGLREERLIYRHLFNERSQKRLFYLAMEVQRRLGLRRAPPPDLQVMIGSQWWCLRRRTVERILEFCRRRRDVTRFFRRTWIPDETFFQTLVRHLVPETEIRSRPPTFLMFTDYGVPVTFCNDHHDLLLRQDSLFARKISPQASELKQRLADLWTDPETLFPVTNEGRQLFGFVTGQGRTGRRFAPRAWERGGSVGPGCEILVLACKKWHVGRRLADSLREVAGIPAYGYLFDETEPPLPDLGGIEGTLEKRTRHRRALLRLLLDHHRTHRLAICIDPAALHVVEDLRRDSCVTRLLEVECRFDDAYLEGHARRIGLAAARTPPGAVAALLPSLRAALAQESERLQATGQLHRIREGEDRGESARQLAAFLSLSEDRAREIAATEFLFAE